MDSYVRRLIDVRVIDGDTVEGTVDLGYYATLTKRKFRLFGINAYEVSRRGRWDDNLSVAEIEEHIRKGKLAKQLVIELAQSAKAVYIESIKSEQGKYGRWLARLWIIDQDDNKINVNDLLIEKNLAIVSVG